MVFSWFLCSFDFLAQHFRGVPKWSHVFKEQILQCHGSLRVPPNAPSPQEIFSGYYQIVVVNNPLIRPYFLGGTLRFHENGVKKNTKLALERGPFLRPGLWWTLMTVTLRSTFYDLRSFPPLDHTQKNGSKIMEVFCLMIPKESMYDIFPFIYHKNPPSGGFNVWNFQRSGKWSNLTSIFFMFFFQMGASTT